MKKIIIALMLILLVGCGSGNSEPSDNVLRVGMECDYAPFNWTQVEANDTAVAINSVDYADGYDVVIASMLAEKMGMEVEIVKTDWNALIPALKAGTIDCIIAGMTETEDRLTEVDFTSPYYESQMVVIARRGSLVETFTDISQLAGYTILGQKNTTYDDIIDQIPGVIHADPLDTYPRMVLSLTSEEVDAITAELPVAMGVVSANPDLVIVKFEEGHGFVVDTSVSIAVNKGNTELLNKLQNALDSIDENTRLEIMMAAVDRQPANEE